MAACGGRCKDQYSVCFKPADACEKFCVPDEDADSDLCPKNCYTG